MATKSFDDLVLDTISSCLNLTLGPRERYKSVCQWDGEDLVWEVRQTLHLHVFYLLCLQAVAFSKPFYRLTSWSLLMEVRGQQLGDGEPWVVPYSRHPQSMSHRKYGMTPFARAVSILFLPTPTIQAEHAYWPAEQQVLDHGYILFPLAPLVFVSTMMKWEFLPACASARGLYVNTSAYVARLLLLMGSTVSAANEALGVICVIALLMTSSHAPSVVLTSQLRLSRPAFSALMESVQMALPSSHGLEESV